MIRCDVDGIPKLVQSIKHHSELGEYVYEFTLFNGNRANILVDHETMLWHPETPAAMLEAEDILLKSYSPQALIELSH